MPEEKVEANIRKKIYFISDLHLGASYFADCHEKERRVVHWLDKVKRDAAEIYLLGDILDYWYEYRYVVPRGFVRFFGKIAELSDAGIKIHWFIGNHDIWIFDYLPDELGIDVIDGSQVKDIMGKRFYLAHGDGVGRHSRSFAFIRSLFRNRFCQILFAAIHPRWTIPFAHGWSHRSRKSHSVNLAPSQSAAESVFKFTKEYAQIHQDIDYFVYGHLHQLVDEKVGVNARMIVLGDWINLDSYGVFDGETFTLKRFME